MTTMLQMRCSKKSAKLLRLILVPGARALLPLILLLHLLLIISSNVAVEIEKGKGSAAAAGSVTIEEEKDVDFEVQALLPTIANTDVYWHRGTQYIAAPANETQPNDILWYRVNETTSVVTHNEAISLEKKGNHLFYNISELVHKRTYLCTPLITMGRKIYEELAPHLNGLRHRRISNFAYRERRYYYMQDADLRPIEYAFMALLPQVWMATDSRPNEPEKQMHFVHLNKSATGLTQEPINSDNNSSLQQPQQQLYGRVKIDGDPMESLYELNSHLCQLEPGSKCYPVTDYDQYMLNGSGFFNRQVNTNPGTKEIWCKTKKEALHEYTMINIAYFGAQPRNCDAVLKEEETIVSELMFMRKVRTHILTSNTPNNFLVKKQSEEETSSSGNDRVRYLVKAVIPQLWKLVEKRDLYEEATYAVLLDDDGTMPLYKLVMDRDVINVVQSEVATLDPHQLLRKENHGESPLYSSRLLLNEEALLHLPSNPMIPNHTRELAFSNLVSHTTPPVNNNDEAFEYITNSDVYERLDPPTSSRVGAS